VILASRLNAAREVAGLFGITVIGAVLRARQSVALTHGVRPAGAVISFLALRQVSPAAPALAEVTAADAGEPELVGASGSRE
jgi:hypothetical protein